MIQAATTLTHSARDIYPDLDVIKPIAIGDNVYLDDGAVILPGITIGSNVVVGASSVVTKNLESNAVYAGIPARKIKNLDEYLPKALSDGVPSKLMSPRNKRQFLDKWFCRNN